MKKWFKFFRNLPFKFPLLIITGFCISFLWACHPNPLGGSSTSVSSPEELTKRLHENILPRINLTEDLVPDAIASQYAVDKIPEKLPKLEDFPLYGAQPSNDAQTIYLEIFSSAEKANAKKQDERWLVDVAEAFNAKQIRQNGKVIQVGIRNIPSGLGAKLIAAKIAKPQGYTPSNELWAQILKSDGINFSVVTPKLAPNHTGFVIQNQLYESLGKNVNFSQLLDAILAGKLMIGYPNPYTSGSGLNLLYTIFWQAAGHQQDKKPLTASDLQLPQVISVFDAFQKQVLVTTQTTLDLKDIFIRDQNKLQAFPLGYQSYLALKQLSGFETLVFIPFGIPDNSPLVSFNWNSSEQQNALKKFATFTTSPEIQQVAKSQGFMENEYQKANQFPPVPSGTILKTALTYWKERKDRGKTVYMSIVIDASGSMQGQRIQAVKDGLKSAINQINAGNYVELITFGDSPRQLVKMAPFDKQQKQRILAAIDTLEPDGSTAMYDGAMVGLSNLLSYKQKDPNGRFYLLLLSDGASNQGLKFNEVKDILKQSNVRIYPIAYGEVNQQELTDLAALRESTVQAGDPKTVENILKDLFQTNL